MIEKSDRDTLAKIGRVPYLTYGAKNESGKYLFNNLGEFVREFVSHFIQRYYFCWERRLEIPKMVFLEEGMTNSGKTFFGRLTKKIIESSVLGSRSKESSHEFRDVTWEEHGLRRAKPNWDIEGIPLNPAEIALANKAIKDETLDALSGPSLVVRVELVGVTAIRRDPGVWHGRDLGSSVAYEIARKKGPFKALPDYERWVVGFVPGPLLTGVMACFADELRSTRTDKGIDLKQAGRVAYLFGKNDEDRELTPEEWQGFNEGASLIQALKTQRVSEALLREFWEQKIIKLPSKKDFIAQYCSPEIERIVGRKRLERFFHAFYSGYLIQHIFEDDLKFMEKDLKEIGFQDSRYLMTEALKAKHALICLNNPSLEDLKLREHDELAWRVQKGWRRAEAV